MPMPRHALQRFLRRRHLPRRKPSPYRRCLRHVGVRAQRQCFPETNETGNRTAKRRTSRDLGDDARRVRHPLLRVNALSHPTRYQPVLLRNTRKRMDRALSPTLARMDGSTRRKSGFLFLRTAFRRRQHPVDDMDKTHRRVERFCPRLLCRHYLLVRATPQAVG